MNNREMAGPVTHRCGRSIWRDPFSHVAQENSNDERGNHHQRHIPTPSIYTGQISKPRRPFSRGALG